MIESRNLNKFVAALLVLALVVCALLLAWPKPASTAGQLKAYSETIFAQDVITIDIQVDEAQWQAMLDNAQAEEFIQVDAYVNGTLYEAVGIRPKGNSSLSQIVSSDSDRYSFKLKFNKYVSGQTLDGLDMLVLNNMMGDGSYMKEAITYDMMQYLGVNSSQTTYAAISVNGEYFGLYFAMEAYRDSFLERNYGDDTGALYNVKTMEMGGGNQEARGGQEMDGNRQPDNRGNRPERGQNNMAPELPDSMELPGNMEPPDGMEVPTGMEAPDGMEAPAGGNFGGGGMMGGMGSSRTNGADLVYVDDEEDSYSAILGNAVSDTTDGASERLIAAIKALNEGENLEGYFDVDQILRYLAVHSFVVNMDSYSSSMCQNFYLYERDGVVTVLPWDYNYAFGGFQSGSASSFVNFPIDTPVQGVTMEARPLISVLLANEEYLARYHEYLQQLAQNYVKNGQLAVTAQRIYQAISPYVETDPSAFYTYAQFEAAYEVLLQAIDLRAESVLGQLGGSVPATTDEQTANPDALIDASALNLSTLGSMGGGGGMGGMGGGRGQWPQGDTQAQEGNVQAQEDDAQTGFPEFFSGENAQTIMQMLQESGGTLSEEQTQQLLNMGLTQDELDFFSSMQGGGFPSGGGQFFDQGGPATGESGSPAASESSNRASIIVVVACILVTLLTTLLLVRLKRRY